MLNRLGLWEKVGNQIKFKTTILGKEICKHFGIEVYTIPRPCLKFPSGTIMELLLTSRYVKTTPKTDDEFISDAKRELDNIVDHYELRGDTVGLNE